MNRWTIKILHAATEMERRHHAHSRAALPTIVK
jgi:hypothetical protein